MKRKKSIKVILWACITLFTGCLIVTFFQIAGYLKGVKADVLHELTLTKTFFIEYNFSGSILNRSFREDDNDISYFVIIQLDSLIESPPFPYDSYYREYNFNTKNKTVKIKVNKNIYQKAHKNAIILKPANSDSIHIDGKSYLLLAKEKYKWNSD